MSKSTEIREAVLELLSDNEQHSVQEIKSHLANINLGDYTEGQFSGSMHTLQGKGLIKRVDRGNYIIQVNAGGRKNVMSCFVVSQIGETGSDIRNNADKLFKYIIKPICDNCGFDAVRVDQLNDANSITQTIIDKLEIADLVIADVSGHNPNVFFEIGFRTRTKKPIIHLKRKGENLPFDVNAIRTFEYDLTDLDSVEEIKERLEQTINSFDFQSSCDGNGNSDEVMGENAIMPLLYQVLDSIKSLQNEVRSNNSDNITAIVHAMQPTQPQLSPDMALQAQLINAAFQNPDNLKKIMELSGQLTQRK